jgi:hypothetical protein
VHRCNLLEKSVEIVKFDNMLILTQLLDSVCGAGQHHDALLNGERYDAVNYIKTVEAGLCSLQQYSLTQIGTGRKVPPKDQT